MADEENEFYESACGYFEGMVQKAEIVRIPTEEECFLLCSENEMDVMENISAQEELYGILLSLGWRRSGDCFYKETCPHCKKCLGIRVPVSKFSPSKSQRKSIRKNMDVQISLCSDPEEFVTDEKIQLLKMYDSRHNPNSSKSEYEIYDELTWMNGISGDRKKEYHGTYNMDYRVDGKLIGVGIVDRAEDSLSSNYFYYDTSDEILKRSIGVFSVIQEIEACRGNLFNGELKSSFYYLGYYIAECDKMNYKIQYKPNELLIDDEWIESNDLLGEN